MMAGKSFVFRFADVEVREREFSLTRAGERLAVEPKAFRVLLILLRSPGKLIPKQELLDAVWGDAAVTENSLARAVAVLRKVLSDEARTPKFIETVATVGYRFVCKVEESEDAERIPETAGETAPEGVAAQGGRRPWRLSPLAVGSVTAALLFGGLSLWYAMREYRARWARDVAIPQIEKLIASDDYLPAFNLALEAEKRIPDDPRLATLWAEMSRVLSFESDPPGAEIYYKKYAAPDSEWRRLGTTPLTKVRIPQGYFEWKIIKAGYEDLHFAGQTPAERLLLPFVPINPIQRIKLDPKGTLPPGMVSVPAGTLRLNIPLFGVLGPFALDEFLIDRYEVTNREFKEFVDGCGYRNRDCWKEPFQKDGRTLNWEEAMNEFRDSTGQPGPSTWEHGTFKAGEEDFPVSGVSWYEAAAYAEFAHKKLPTVEHWYQAAAMGGAPAFLPVSNFNHQGPEQVGQSKAITGSGAYDMAGNVKEWTLNEAENGLRFILGGGWSDTSHLFYNPDARSAFDRSPANGFRCVRYDSPLDGKLTGPMHRDFRDYSKEKPASDELYRAYQSHYVFEPSELKSSVDAVTNTSPYWRVEKVSFQTGYGNERLPAYLFLPKGATPPYNPIVYFPGLTARYLPSSSNIPLGTNYDSGIVDFLVRSGRAVLYPIYRGLYERSLPVPDNPLARRDERIHWVQDIRRSVDYLATRPDLDLSHLTYFGFSMGGIVGPMFVALEPRFKTAVWLDGGMQLRPELPESDPFNFLPRVKIPVLMVNGRSDFTFLLAAQQVPMFRFLGTPEKDKKHVVFDGAHGVFFYHRNEVEREVLSWLDQYEPIKK